MGVRFADHLSRRRLIVALAAAAVVSGCTGRDDVEPAAQVRLPGSAGAAWRRLRVGNERFAAGTSRHPRAGQARRAALVDGQQPFATVLTCADSRVPPELLFDQGLGDLFTIRSAGEVLDDAVLGSIEYAVGELAAPLVVVLGHSGCGAVRAAVDVVDGATPPSGDLGALVQRIEPAVHRVPRTDDRGAFLRSCVQEQAESVAAALPRRSPAIDAAVAGGTTTVVAAVYDLSSGRVTRVT